MHKPDGPGGTSLFWIACKLGTAAPLDPDISADRFVFAMVCCSVGQIVVGATVATLDGTAGAAVDSLTCPQVLFARITTLEWFGIGGGKPDDGDGTDGFGGTGGSGYCKSKKLISENK